MLIKKSPDACCRFFQQFLVLFAMHQMSTSLYRLIASIGRTQVMVNMLGIQALIAILILGGFVISKGKITAIKFLNSITVQGDFFSFSNMRGRAEYYCIKRSAWKL